MFNSFQSSGQSNCESFPADFRKRVDLSKCHATIVQATPSKQKHRLNEGHFADKVPSLKLDKPDKKSTSQPIRKNSKTLPRGFTIGPGSESSGDSVFGLYGDLMNVEEYEVGSVIVSKI